MNNFQDQIVMISGGSEGIGYAIAERLGRQGAKISLCARNQENLNQAASHLKSNDVECLAAQTDVSNPSDVENWFAETEKAFGPCTVMVNNAGIAGDGPILELTEEQWDKTMSVNCRGVFLCTKRALPSMMERKSGRIVMISSIAGKYYRPTHSLYFATKWALNGFSRSLAKEVSEHGIHVKIICPGMTETNFSEEMGGRPHDQNHPYVTPELIAEHVEHACLEPDGIDTIERCIFPSWQLPRQGRRR